jgi:hypothetical protein
MLTGTCSARTGVDVTRRTRKRGKSIPRQLARDRIDDRGSCNIRDRKGVAGDKLSRRSEPLQHTRSRLRIAAARMQFPVFIP